MSGEAPAGLPCPSPRFVRSLVRAYAIPVPYHHWQLRNMIKSAGSSLVYSNVNMLCALDVNTRDVTCMMDDVGYSPTSFDVNDDYVACGGAEGEVTVMNRASRKTVVLPPSRTIVNSVKLRDHYLYICNNERMIVVYDLRKRAVLDRFVHKSNVNNCEMSKDGKYVVACGDTNDVVLLSRSGGVMRKVDTFKTVYDGGFGISWSNDDTMFAVGTQDGYVCIFDTRRRGQIAQITSKQHPFACGAVRNLSFSKKPHTDVLVFIEHFSYFSVVDAYDFKMRQEICVNSGSYDKKSITGLSINTSDTELYVSTEDEILAYSIDTNVRRVTCHGGII